MRFSKESHNPGHLGYSPNDRDCVIFAFSAAPRRDAAGRRGQVASVRVTDGKSVVSGEISAANLKSLENERDFILKSWQKWGIV